MIATKLEMGQTAGSPPPHAGRTLDGGRHVVLERSVPIPLVSDAPAGSGSGRVILYERLTGEAARRRATSPEPEGAGMTSEQVAGVEYIEIWSTPPPACGYDFRMYSFGGALLASRSTRA
jgi:hypothetical protein